VRKLIIIIPALLIPGGISTSYARGGMHGTGESGLMAPANPAVPPSLTSDPRLLGTAPLPPHQQPTVADFSAINNVSLAPTEDEKKIDRVVSGICRGC
jgi:hypothetical protein